MSFYRSYNIFYIYENKDGESLVNEVIDSADGNPEGGVDTLFLPLSLDEKAQLDLDLTWTEKLSREQVGAVLHWKIENSSGADATEWSQSSGDFSEEYVSITWDDSPFGTDNSEFTITRSLRLSKAEARLICYRLRVPQAIDNIFYN